MTDRRVEQRPSETALIAALRRTLANMAFPDGKFGPDGLAKYFLPGYYRFFLRSKDVRANTLKKLDALLPGVQQYIIARTVYFDRWFVDALKSGLSQIVLLGAGYDSRAYRFAALNRGTRVFELDIAPTQNRKKKCLKAARIEIPPQVEFVPVDFNHEAPGEVLEAAGWEPGQKTLFLWEGVSYYLEPGPAQATLAFAGQAAPGSRIVFDYAVSLAAEDMEQVYGGDAFTQSMQAYHADEALTFSLGDGEIGPFLVRTGLSLVEHLDNEQIEAACLADERGARLGRITGQFRFAVAEPVGRE